MKRIKEYFFPINPEDKETKDVGFNSFKIKRLIGIGGFSKVYCVSKREGTDKGKIFAMKVVSTEKIPQPGRAIESLLAERNILEKLKHPLICKLYYAFLDENSYCFVTDLALGGDLRYHINYGAKNSIKSRKYNSSAPVIPERELLFQMRCIVSALAYIHKQGIIHRDIKPENMLLNADGYVLLTDFGLARTLQNDVCFSNSGTKLYMSPEVLARRGSSHSFGADIFSLGLVLYEFIVGEPPFNLSEKQNIGISSKKERAKHLETKINVLSRFNLSQELLQLLEAMLQFEQSERIGSRHGASELKNHSWFQFDDWEALERKILKAPFISKKGQQRVSPLVRNENILSNFQRVSGSAANTSKPITHLQETRLSSNNFAYNYQQNMQLEY